MFVFYQPYITDCFHGLFKLHQVKCHLLFNIFYTNTFIAQAQHFQ